MLPLTVHRYGNPDAPAVVLLHGLTDSGTTWPDLVAHWGDAWDVHAPDLRGHGSSPRFTDDELGRAPEVMLADVLGLLDQQPRPVALVGHSLGSLLSSRFAARYPAQVSHLVMVSPPIYPMLAEVSNRLERAQLDQMLDLSRSLAHGDRRSGTSGRCGERAVETRPSDECLGRPVWRIQKP